MRNVIDETMFVDVVMNYSDFVLMLIVTLAGSLIGIICNEMLPFLCFSFSSPACRLSVNNSIGLIDVANRDPLHCLWRIGNVGVANAVAVFIIQTVIIRSCRYLELTGFPPWVLCIVTCLLPFITRKCCCQLCKGILALTRRS